MSMVTVRRSLFAASVVATFALTHGASMSAGSENARRYEIGFHNAEASHFIAKFNSVSLTPTQEKIRAKALSAIKAPSCKDHSIATCCRPWNFAKSVWGLSSTLIAQQGCDAGEVSEAVEKWIGFIDPRGGAGGACYGNRCAKSFGENGCGSMDERRVL